MKKLLQYLVLLILLLALLAGAYFGTIGLYKELRPPRYYYQGQGEFDPDTALQIYKEMGDSQRQSPVQMMPNGKVYMMYSFNSDERNVFDLAITRECGTEYWLYPLCLMLVVLIELLVVIVLVGLLGRV